MLFATGLSGTDYVEVQLLAITESTPPLDLCCPGPVLLPGIGATTPLLRLCCGSCTPQPVRLTPANPWYVLRDPRGLWMRACVQTTDTSAVIEVFKADVAPNGSTEQAPC